MKLKTLKDLKRYAYHDQIRRVPRNKNMVLALDYNEVKREAIKWYHRSDDNKHKFIRKFFNITEDELQDEAREEDLVL